MERDSAFCSIHFLLHLLLLLTCRGSSAQKVKVEPEVVSYPGETVVLRCQFPDPGQTQLTQVSWILEKSSGARTNIAVFHPGFGVNYPMPSPVQGRVSFTMDPPSLANPTIQITDIEPTDEGKYICEYAAYPTGNEKGVSSLVILAKPENSGTSITVQAGTSPVAVARCQSVNGRPAANISWSPPSANLSQPVLTANSDNTVTVQSDYYLAPTPADNGREISCTVTHRTLPTSEIFPVKLDVQYPPQVQIVGYDSNWYIGRTNVVLTCLYQGNPIPPTVNWKMSLGRMPDSVEVAQNKLTIRKVDDSVNGTFICEVTNSLGTGKDQVAVFVREASMPSSNAGVVAGAVIGSLLALLLVGALVAVLVTRSRRQQQGYRGNSKGNSAPYDSVARLFGSSGSKNGTGNHGNNNAPIYKGDVGLSEKAGNMGLHQGGVALVENTPTAQDILLSSELDEAERRKFDDLEDEDERYDQFSGSGPILQLRPHDEDPGPAYLDDDMESQRDGSIISRTAVFV
ncbi:nectin-2 isoform X1 [Silurus meridionalis]|uniref:nectin-2 isoform X1 n=1 Tax=Silurus meridionalis TaxID=175797 RepID=UPI001EEC41ED|nr:nectin-2 isoform X1 [Silurus meridionalis]XP_046702333.1 nectin-2 isoform X1 [Silurus meridionalis]